MTYDQIVGLRAIRDYRDEPLGADDLNAILEAARWTGSSKNAQNWAFIVVDDPEQRDRLAGAGTFTGPVRAAPVTIAIVEEPGGYRFDTGRVAQNVMLAAQAIGVASCPVTLHREEVAAEVLGLPRGATCRFAVALGYPADELRPGLFHGRKAAQAVDAPQPVRGVTAAPIGILDSGVGGLSIYAETRRLLPAERVLYVADQGFGMYGERTLEAVRERSELIAGRLISHGAGVVVVACNSASAAALAHLRAMWPDVPFVGMEPAVKPAALVSSNGTIGVLATEATFQSELFASVVDRFASEHEVVAVACPDLAEAIEDDAAVIDRLVSQYVGEVVYRGADVVVLGCTHYSLIRGRIAAQARPAQLIDPAPAVARQVARLVDADDAGEGDVAFLTTGDPDRFATQLDRLGFDRSAVGTLTV